MGKCLKKATISFCLSRLLGVPEGGEPWEVQGLPDSRLQNEKLNIHQYLCSSSVRAYYLQW